MEKILNNKINVRATLRAMKKGESVTFAPNEVRESGIRNACSVLKWEGNARYSCTRTKDGGFIVTRS